MIVAYQPGGNIRDARVVLKPDEKLPNRYNTREAEVYREDPAHGFEWVLVKPRFSILPEDSDILSQPKLPDVDILSLTPEPENVSFEHADIIRMEDGGEKTEEE
jgi:hypothetical protein